MDTALLTALLASFLLPLLTSPCPLALFTCEGQYSNTDVTICSNHKVQCVKSVLWVQFYGRGLWYETGHALFPEKTFKVFDPTLGSQLQQKGCDFLYYFTNPIHGFYPSRIPAQIKNLTMFNCTTGSYDFSRDLFREKYSCSYCGSYHLYYSYNPGNKEPSYSKNCSRQGRPMVEWELAFSESPSGFVDFSLVSVAFVHNRTSNPECFSCMIREGKCSSINGGSSECRCQLDCKIGSHQRLKKMLLLSFGASLGCFLLCIIVLLPCTRRSCFEFLENEHEKSKPSVEGFLVAQGPLALIRYSYRQVKRMTNSFRTKLGHGGYGSVFQGHLTVNNDVLIPVAVKLLGDSKGSGEDFINEVASIGRTNHVNIVSLLGFCSQGSKRALIYEFMSNGSLEKYLFSSNHNTTASLGWDQLYNIALGIAKGLEYLHKGCRTRIVHFDIKPHNILLDKDFCPKISDFGLAKFSRTNESILSMDCARGTIGYIAPEVYSRSFGVVSSKSDVYSYGMMVLEMVGGRKNFDGRLEKSSEMYFPHWIYEHLDRHEDLVGDEISPERADVVKKMAMVGLWCIQTNPSCRPSISRAVEMLEGRAEDMEMPPKPYICSPERAMPNTNCSYNTSMSASLFQQN